MEILSQPDLMLYKCVYNNVKAHAAKIMFLANFRLGVGLVRDEVCLFGRLY